MGRSSALVWVTLALLSGTGCGSGSDHVIADGGTTDGPGRQNDAAHPGADGGGTREGGGSRDGEGGATTTGAWVMGYFSNWDDAANGGFYPVSAIDWSAVTHVAAAFYVPDGNGGFESGDFDPTLAAPLISAAHSHGRKALASIGGSGSGPAFEGSTSASNLSTFLTNLEALLSMGYDGLDIDWEGGNLSTAMDQSLETSLITSLRSRNPGALLTMTAGYENENSLDDLSFYGKIAASLDRVNLMTYSMSGAWPGWMSWHSSPLHWNKSSSTPTGIDASVSHYLSAGVPAAKLGVGSGFYGECYTSPVTAPVQTLGDSEIAASDGVMAYRNILSSYYASSAYHYDDSADVPYLTLSGSNAEACTFVSYEDATSVAAKAAWVKAQGLGGIIVWTLSEDYIASGATVEEQNPLVEAMKSVF